MTFEYNLLKFIISTVSD